MKKYIIIVAMFVISFASLSFTYAENEGSNSDNTEAEENVKQLKLNWVKVIWKNWIILEFDSNIDEKSDKDISVKFAWNNDEEIFVDTYIVDKNNVELVLENDLESNKDYEIIIFSIMWEDGSTITSGLDWALEFTTPDLSVFNKEVEEEKEIIEEEEEIEMTSAGENSDTETINANENLAWKEIKNEDLKNNIEVVASNKEELSKTGPEHILLTILALILAWLVWHILSQRKNKQI